MIPVIVRRLFEKLYTRLDSVLWFVWWLFSRLESPLPRARNARQPSCYA